MDCLTCLLLGLVSKVNGSDPKIIQVYTEQLNPFLIWDGLPARLDVEHSLLGQKLQLCFLVGVQLQGHQLLRLRQTDEYLTSV